MDGKIIQEVEKSMSGLKVLQAESITRGLTFGFDVTPLFCTISVDNISAQIVRYSVGTVRIEYNNESNPLLVTFLG